MDSVRYLAGRCNTYLQFGFCLFFATLFTLNFNLLYICLINMYGIYNLGESDKIIQYNIW